MTDHLDPVTQLREDWKGLDQTKKLTRLLEVAEHNKLFSVAMSNALQGHLQNFHEQLLQVQQRTQQMWNLLNGVVRVMEVLGIDQGYWEDQEEFQEFFTDCIRALLTEAIAHQKNEMDRIKQEKEEGREPKPMVPFRSMGDGLVSTMIQVTEEETEKALREDKK